MPDLYLGSRAHQLRQLPIGQTAIVRMSTVQVDQKGRVWLRPDERLSDDADLQSSGRAGTEDWCRCWVLTLPILADENLPKFEPGKVYWIVSRYLPVTEVREVHIKPKVSQIDRLIMLRTLTSYNICYIQALPPDRRLHLAYAAGLDELMSWRRPHKIGFDRIVVDYKLKLGRRGSSDDLELDGGRFR